MAIDRVGVLKHLRLCVVFGGGLACFQAVVWVALTMVGVIMYGDCDPGPVAKFDNLFGLLLREMYFRDESCFNTTGGTESISEIVGYTSPEQMLVWGSVYMAMSFFWLITSILFIMYVTWEKISSALLYMYMWSCLTLAISIVDLVFGALLGKDMDTISKFYSVNTHMDLLTLQMMKLSAGVLMTVVMRGFILWIINVACAVYIFLCIVEVNREQLKDGGNDYLPSGMARGPIGAYDNPSIENRSSQWLNGAGNMDRPHLKSASYGRANSQYGESNLGYANSNFPSSNAVNVSSFGNNNNSPKFANNNNSSPNFGNNTNNSSPNFGNNNYNNNVNQSRQPPAVQPKPWERAREPFTPSPDYDSPPPQRAARSALKQYAPPPPSSSLYRR